ncbi:MAG: gamma-glutamyl-gamma-aminobutyrate hydrolase family protein [Alphaproteobacteria bacterium]
MTAVHDLTPDYLQRMKETPETLRVGVLAPVDGEGRVQLCERWTAPFVNNGMETLRLPVEPLPYPDPEQPYKIPVEEILSHIDGLLLPGGHSHIHPSIYMPYVTRPEDRFEPARDYYAIALVKAAHKQKIPTLAICRGMQEMGVAFGMHLEKLEKGFIDHAEGYEHDGNFERMDELVHDITVQPGGVLADIFGNITRGVNSIHEYGFTLDRCRLNEAFRIEALAPDNVIEAMSSKDRVFLAMQAHPEFNLGEGKNFWHKGIFGERFERIREYHQARINHVTAGNTPDFGNLAPAT